MISVILSINSDNLLLICHIFPLHTSPVIPPQKNNNKQTQYPNLSGFLYTRPYPETFDGPGDGIIGSLTIF